MNTAIVRRVQRDIDFRVSVPVDPRTLLTIAAGTAPVATENIPSPTSMNFYLLLLVLIC